MKKLGARVIRILSNYVYDTQLSIDSIENKYSARIENLLALHKKDVDENIRGAVERTARPSKMSLPLSAYTGNFSSPLYGELMVTIKEGQLFVKLGNLASGSTYFTEPESIRVELVPGSGEPIYFKKNNGEVNELKYAGVDFKK